MPFDLTEEEKMIQKTARDFTAREIEPLVEKIENENRTPRELLKKLADVGFLRLTIPTATEVILLGLRIHAAYGYTKEYKIRRLHQAVLGGLGILTAIELNKSIVSAGLVR